MAEKTVASGGALALSIKLCSKDAAVQCFECFNLAAVQECIAALVVQPLTSHTSTIDLLALR